MCARLLSCPLCSQPGFVTLDAMRAGLVSVATRPLTCPVCDDTLIGIDKLTIHLFGHTINANGRTEPRRHAERGQEAFRASNCGVVQPRSWDVEGALIARLNMCRSQRRGAEKIHSTVSESRSSECDSSILDDKPDANSQRLVGNRIIVPRRGDDESEQATSQRDTFCLSNLTNTNILGNVSDNQAYALGATSTETPRNATCLSSVPDNLQKRIANDVVGCGKHSSCAERQEENSNQFSDSWIESLLLEDDAKCSSKTSTPEEKNGFSIVSKILPRVPNGHENRGTIESPQTTIILENSRSSERLNSVDSAVQKTEIVFEKNEQTSLNSNNLLLPQWKAFRLLAMKEKSERCDMCGIHFPDVNFLVLHKQLAHMINEKDAKSTSEETLKNCPCHLCTKVFKTRGTLMVHMRVAHMGYNVGFLSKDNESESVCCRNGFNCPTCGKNFKKEQHVTQHLKTHEGKQWECDVCSKMFTTKYFLKKHKRLHSGEMPYKCTICEKTFTFQQSYHKHRLYHKDDKPHTCGTCGRSFKELSTLHNHERIHTGEKPFACETCGKCFRQRVSYLVHRRIHTGVMPYKCTGCGKSFRYKVSQRTHKCPAQTEDAGSTVPEIPPENPNLTPTSCTDCSTIPKTEIFLENHSSTEIAPSETNKFILIVNTQGQSILTRESSIVAETSSCLNESGILSTENVSKTSLIGERRERSTNQKSSTENPNDFFSLVISPMENDVSSPSAEMEHLRLSSPQNDHPGRNENDENSRNPREHFNFQTDFNNAIDGIFRENCTVNGPLETINEESLKQLLYGIDRKL